MESKLHENLYFAGEIVNIDALRVDLTSECLDEWVYLGNSLSER
jgi:hypothetical protein